MIGQSLPSSVVKHGGCRYRIEADSFTDRLPQVGWWRWGPVIPGAFLLSLPLLVGSDVGCRARHDGIVMLPSVEQIYPWSILGTAQTTRTFSRAASRDGICLNMAKCYWPSSDWTHHFGSQWPKSFKHCFSWANHGESIQPWKLRETVAFETTSASSRKLSTCNLHEHDYSMTIAK